MSFFESLVALLLAAIVLLQVARRLSVPYPAMLALAGVGLGLIPGSPRITLDPHTALALFIAPALVDAAFDFPAATARRMWRPLVALAVVAVLLSTAAVAWLGVAVAGLPLYAAIALGAIVAPPDAAAASATLGSVDMPRRSIAVLKGESLLNDASALLLFGAATAVQSNGGIDGGIALQLGLAVPGGVLMGLALAWAMKRVQRFVTGTLGGNLLEFVTTFAAWILAERLGLSAVLCLVTFAMAIARSAGLQTPPRMRVHSFAVWSSVVFLLNVVAFLLMGLQARIIVSAMEPERLWQAARFAGLVVVCIVVVRMGWVLAYNRLARHLPLLRGDQKPATLRQGVLVGWAGMRGLLTLATAFALPRDFPQRDLIVLTAFAAVLATLVIQGLTLAPLVRLLGLGDTKRDRALDEARVALADSALATLAGAQGPAAEHWRYGYETTRAAAMGERGGDALEEKRRVGRKALYRERKRLEELRAEQRIDSDEYLALQEQLDFQELALSSEDERRIEES